MTFFEPQMYARKLQVLSLAIGITAIAACSGDGNRSGDLAAQSLILGSLISLKVWRRCLLLAVIL